MQRLHRTTPNYRVIDSWGREHEKSFKVEILVSGKVVAEGLGK
ncbi:MAG: ribonuclease III, partial [Bacteroidetes bacterium]|nr:ribonuclease III [Bacteroidota bacterium]